MLQATREYYRSQQRLTAAGVLEARRALRRGVPFAAEVLAAFQILVARDAADVASAMLDEQGIDADPVAEVRVTSVAGTASDGRSLVGLLDQAETDRQFGLMVATQLQDVGRSVLGLGMAVRPQVSGYIRVLNPPSCSRCAVLAGKFFRWNHGFDRHPKCDCRHELTTQQAWRDLIGSHDPTVNPHAYFEGLPTAAQLDARYPNLTVKMRQESGLYSREDIFSKSGAMAIRDGADLNQVVNARRGMETAQVFGRQLTFTREGVTRRGLAFDSLSQRGTVRTSDELATRLTSTGPELRRITRERARAPRVMPESIYKIAEDREDALRLLKLNGFIL